MLLLAAIILLPVIPAYLLFAALPGHAAVRGPLKGFKINLSGAFAGYFSIVLLVLSSYAIWKPAPAPAVRRWVVRGRIVYPDGLPVQPLDPKNVTLSPPSLELGSDGNFLLSFAAAPNEDGEGLVFPDLIVTADGYKPLTVHLSPGSWDGVSADIRKAREQTHVIHLSDIKLDRLPAYQPAAASLTAIASSPGHP